jgi:adenosylcobyric acid synthase
VRPGQRIGDADVVIIPGSKNTIEDFRFLKKEGYADEILRLHQSGKMIIGICGGYQMLGRAIRDPLGMETSWGEIEGLGLLEVETTLEKEKMTFQVKAVPLNSPMVAQKVILRGYEIHMGDTQRVGAHPPAFKIIERLGQKVEVEDGAVSKDGRVWGTYLHGLFDNDGFRRSFIDSLREKKSLLSDHRPGEFDYRSFKEQEYDKLAAVLRKELDMPQIYRIIGISSSPSPCKEES